VEAKKMKFASVMLALAGSLYLTGCSDLVSLNPLATDKQATTDSNLPGTWKGDDRDLYVIQQDGSSYSIVYTDGKGGSMKFGATLFKAGAAELLDVVSENEAILQVPVHAAVRIWPEGSQLRWAFLDSKWLREQAAQQLVSQPSGDGLLLTSPGEAVHSFLLKYGADPKAYEKESVLTRME
jgi:hypothetical protein